MLLKFKYQALDPQPRRKPKNEKGIQVLPGGLAVLLDNEFRLGICSSAVFRAESLLSSCTTPFSVYRLGLMLH